MESDWPDFRKLVRRRYAKRVWIPLALSRSNEKGEFGSLSYQAEFEGAHSLMIPMENRHLGDEYSWSDDHEHRPWAEKDFYKPADQYWKNYNETVGTRLVLRQPLPDDRVIWHLHQDFIVALDLVFEDGNWVRPAESYEVVARYVYDESGNICGVEARSEFLKDYLCARNSALRISTFRDFNIIVKADEIPRTYEGDKAEEFEDGKLEFRSMRIDESGNPAGSGVAVFRVSRTDVDPEDDVPVMGPESGDNTESASWSFNRGDADRIRLMADYWRDEWLEPGSASVRVRWDKVPSEVTFTISADGEKSSADDLKNEDIGKWLWFKPGIIPTLLERRGAVLQWYTEETGAISTPSDPAVHFGINDIGLLNAYAFDVARLPEWERRLWGGFNTAPDGKVSNELLMAQVRAVPASTQAPEKFVSLIINQLSTSWNHRFGTDIFRPHEEFAEIISRCHRFRAVEKDGLFRLAKDLARITADSLDAGVAQEVAPPSKGQKWGSLKSFENAIGSLCSADFAREITGPLFATYELRLSDAHLPKKDRLEAFKILGIDEDAPLIFSGQKMIHMVVSSLNACRRVIEDSEE